MIHNSITDDWFIPSMCIAIAVAGTYEYLNPHEEKPVANEVIRLDAKEQLLFHQYCQQEARTAEMLAKQMEKIDAPKEVLELTKNKALVFNAVAALLLRDDDAQVFTPENVGSADILKEPEDFDVHPDAD